MKERKKERSAKEGLGISRVRVGGQERGERGQQGASEGLTEARRRDQDREKRQSPRAQILVAGAFNAVHEPGHLDNNSSEVKLEEIKCLIKKKN